MTLENVIASSTLTDKIDFLAGAFSGMDANNKIRTFMSVGRDATGADWLSARGIRDKFDENYREFLLEQFFVEDHENFIGKSFNADQVDAFCMGIGEELMFIKEGGIDLFNEIMDVCKNEFADDESALENSVIKFLYEYVPDETNKRERVPKQDIPQAEGEEKQAPKRNRKEKQQETEPAKQVPAAPVAEPKEIVSPTEMQLQASKEKAHASFNLELPLAAMVNSAVNAFLNGSDVMQQIGKRIEAEAQKMAPNQINIGERKQIIINGKLHSAFKEALELTMQEGQIFVAGAAGTGKTTLAGQIAKALDVRFGHISCTAGMSEAHLLGRMDAHGNYLIAQFVDIYENGGVFLFDEIDAADANTMLIINSALANGVMSVPNRKDKPFANRHEKFYCVCAANTWGFGSNEYAGRNILDAAFLDRFAGSRLMVGYDTELEKEISREQPTVAKVMWQVRENVNKNRIRRVVSTRSIVSGVRSLANGKTIEQYLDRFFCGWTTEEIKKALENVNVKN